MDENLQELVSSRGVDVRVDADRGVIHGVKLLGLESRNGRKYLARALADAAALYEGAKVNVNHPKGSPLAARDYQDRLGSIRSVRATANGLFGDLHFNPKHALAEQLTWDAVHAPENKILLGSLGEIDRALVKATATVAGGATTTSYAIQAGALGAETATAFTTLPPARNRGDSIASGAWALLLWVNNGWELREVERGGGEDRVWWATANTNILPFDSGEVMLSTGENVTALNWSDRNRIRIGEPVFAWKDPTDEQYYCIGGRQPRWFKGTLAETPTFGDPTVDVVTTSAIDGGVHPGAITAANDWKCHGQNGAPCLIVENLSSGGYELVKVMNVETTVLSGVSWSSPKLQKTTTKIVSNVGSSGSTSDVLTAVAVELIDAVNWAKPTLGYTRRHVLTFEDSAGTGGTILSTTDVVVDRLVFVAGLNLYQYLGSVTVFEAGVATPALIAYGSLCQQVVMESVAPYIAYPASLYSAPPFDMAATFTSPALI